MNKKNFVQVVGNCLLLLLTAITIILPAQARAALSAADVQRIVGQAVAEAKAQGAPGTIAVVDRVGNVLGVFQMAGAAQSVRASSGRGVPAGNGLEGATVPASLAAISKAITGAYLSSGGNAFTTRTANQIIQEHFNPGEFNQPGGPLFGVQFSQLPCGDLTVKGGSGGPKPAPLGLSADPGGLPLYQGGVLVGGVGAIVDGVYGTDLNITSGLDRDVDELVALAGTLGFEAPTSIRADRIAVDGKTLRFTDVGPQDLASQGGGPTEPPQSGSGDPTGPEDAQQDDETQQSDGTQQGDETQQGDGTQQGGDTTAVASGGTFIAVSGFTSGAPKAGVGGTPLVGAAPRNGGDGADALTAREVQVLLSSALNVASRARAQIRQPPSSGARVTISVVDTNGTILGIARRPDAPVFGVDVSLQKARTAAFFSRSDAGAQLSAAGMGGYVSQVRAFGLPTALADGIAFSDRAGGNLSRPFYPDGIDGNPPGPFSKPIGLWSPFNVGLQLDLIGGRLTSSGGGCTSIRGLQNGMQIFPGSVPIYRGSQLVGGIGVSGDGVDQDDMIAFLGLHEAGLTLGTINNADPAIRADTLAPRGVRLRYINCPQNPFLGSSEANPCAGK